MKQTSLLFFTCLLVLLCQPLCSFASIPRGAAFLDVDIIWLVLIILAIMSNAILCLINIFWKKRGVRIYTICLTSLLLPCALYLFSGSAKAGAMATFIVLLHGFFIYLSLNKSNNEAQR